MFVSYTPLLQVPKSFLFDFYKENRCARVAETPCTFKKIEIKRLI